MCRLLYLYDGYLFIFFPRFSIVHRLLNFRPISFMINTRMIRHNTLHTIVRRGGRNAGDYVLASKLRRAEGRIFP